MAEIIYVVCEGKKYTGKHRVYEAGQEFPAHEIFGKNAQDAMRAGVIERKGSKKADKKGNK